MQAGFGEMYFPIDDTSMIFATYFELGVLQVGLNNYKTDFFYLPLEGPAGSHNRVFRRHNF